MKRLTACPDHAPASPTSIDAWACPGQCPHFVAEIDHRIEEMTVGGHFWRLVPGRRIGGRMVVQEYQGFIPYGSPKPIGPPRRTSFLSRIREMYRRKRR